MRYFATSISQSRPTRFGIAAFLAGLTFLANAIIHPRIDTPILNLLALFVVAEGNEEKEIVGFGAFALLVTTSAWLIVHGISPEWPAKFRLAASASAITITAVILVRKARDRRALVGGRSAAFRLRFGRRRRTENGRSAPREQMEGGGAYPQDRPARDDREAGVLHGEPVERLHPRSPTRAHAQLHSVRKDVADDRARRRRSVGCTRVRGPQRPKRSPETS